MDAKRPPEPAIRGITRRAGRVEQPLEPFADRIEECNRGHQGQHHYDRQRRVQDRLGQCLENPQRSHVHGHGQAGQQRVTEGIPDRQRREKDPLPEDRVGCHDEGQGDERDAHPVGTPEVAREEAECPADRCQPDSDQGREGLVASGSVPIGLGVGAYGQRDRQRKDGNAQADPAPRQQLTGDAGQLQARRDHGDRMRRIEQLLDAHHRPDGICRAQSRALPGGIRAFDREGQDDVQRRRRKQEGGDVLEGVEVRNDGRIAGRALDEDRHRPGHEQQADPGEHPWRAIAGRARQHSQPKPRR